VIRGADRGAALAPLARELLGRCTFPGPGSPLTCAVSGGRDSLALLVLSTLAGCRVTVVHVDHGLREGSAQEAGLVAEAAERLGAAFRAERVDIPPGPNLEARARAARFSVLPADVATGHTMDDQAETVLCNLLRGAGPDGLAGMRPGPHHPLLALRRSETRAVCEEAGLEWVEDPTNADPRHLRNRVRHELLPMCADIAGRDPVPLLSRLAELVAADDELLDELATEAVPDATRSSELARAPGPLAGRAVRRWLRALGATPDSGGRRATVPGPDRQPPSLAEVRRVLRVAAGEAVGTELAGGWRVRRSAGKLIATPPDGRPDRAPDGRPDPAAGVAEDGVASDGAPRAGR
jgi:tRNA(Ile)-lysidine synthase